MYTPPLNKEGFLKDLCWIKSVPVGSTTRHRTSIWATTMAIHWSVIRTAQSNSSWQHYCLVTLYSVKCGLHNIFTMPWQPNESFSIIGQYTCVHVQGIPSLEPEWRKTDGIFLMFIFLQLVMSTNICPELLKQQRLVLPTPTNMCCNCHMLKL